ncbi:MAG: acyl-CoA dehydrogenase family protein [Acidocella sp.]|nr:acyl-CoA dehydrogenase family protein [Acidocella sp.]
MSTERQMVLDTAERIFAGGATPETMWQQVIEAGLPALLLPEADGGFGGDWGDAFSLIRLAGYHAVGLPLGEAIIGVALFGSEAISAFDSRVVFAESASGTLDGGNFTGILHGVASGRTARLVLASIAGQTVGLDISGAIVTPGETLAGDPCDSLEFRAAPASLCPVPTSLFALGALPRIAQIAGAMDGALALAIGHANERQQFGKPIGKLQAVQQNLAVMAEAAAAVNCAGQAAFQAAGQALVSTGGAVKFDPEFEIAAAKLRANIAVDAGTAIAHQVHGGIGFTQDYALHRFTRRLYVWRAEFGNERFWAERLGVLTAVQGGDKLWAYLTARSDLVAMGAA